jgi:hypothetical protein
VHRADNLTTFMYQMSGNLGASTSLNPQGLSRDCFTLPKLTSPLGKPPSGYHSSYIEANSEQLNYMTQNVIPGSTHRTLPIPYPGLTRKSTLASLSLPRIDVKQERHSDSGKARGVICELRLVYVLPRVKVLTIGFVKT